MATNSIFTSWTDRFNLLQADKTLPVQVEYGTQYEWSVIVPAITEAGHTVWDGKEMDAGGLQPFFRCEEVRSYEAFMKTHRDEQGILHREKIKGLDETGMYMHIKHMMEMLMADNVVGGYVDGKKLTVFLGQGDFLSHMTKLGIKIKMGRKLMKRLKAIQTMYLLKGYIRDVNLKICEDPCMEGVMDGAFVIKQSFMKKLISKYTGVKGKEERNKIHLKRLQDAKIFSFRGITTEGLLKGHALVVPDAQWKYRESDIYTHRCNIKSEVSCEEGFFMACNPQGEKSQPRTNVQYLLNNPWMRRELFGETGMIHQFFLDLQYKMKTGEKIEDYKDIISRDEKDDFSVSHVYREAAYWFAETGHKLGHSVSLRRQAFDAYTKLLTKDENKLNVPVPHSRAAQLFSATMMEMAGCPSNCSDEEIKECSYGFFVSDNSWENNKVNWGGCDMDDTFSFFFRTYQGKARVIVMRSPNYIGEYATFSPGCNMDELGRVYKEDMTFTHNAWPETDLSDMPLQSTQKKTKYIGLPEPEVYEGEVNKAYLAKKWLEGMSGMSPGQYVNTLMLLTYLNKEAADEILASMEDVVDYCTQGGTPAGMVLIKRFCEDVIQQVIDSGRPVDRTLALKFGKDSARMVLEDGWLTQAKKQIKDEVSKSWKWVEENVPLEIPEEVKRIKVSKEEHYHVLSVWNWYKRVINTTRDTAEAAGVATGAEKGSKLYQEAVTAEWVRAMRAIKEIITPLLTTVEQVRMFAHKLHFITNADLSKKGDAVLLSNTPEGKGVWDLYYRILKGE